MRQIYTRRNITIILAISLALIGFFVWYTYRNMNRASADSKKVTKTLQVLKALEDIKDDMQNIETAQRGYVLSGQPQFLDPYFQTMQRVARDTAAVHDLYALYPSRHTVFDQLLYLVREKIKFVKGTIESRQRGYDSAYNSIQSGKGRMIMDDFLAIIAGLEKEDRTLLTSSNLHREEVGKETTNLFITLATVFCLLIAILFRRIHFDLIRRDSNEKEMSFLADMVEQAGDAIISADSNFNILSWNKGAEEMYGYTKEEALGHKYHELLKSNRTDAERSTIVEVIRVSGYFSEEIEYIKKNDSSIIVLASYTLLRNKQSEIIGCTVVHRNITDRKLAEQLLREFNQKLNVEVQNKTAEIKETIERLRIISKATNDVIWDADLKPGGMVWWNENLSRKFGYRIKGDTTTSTFWDDHLHPDDKERVLRNIDHVLIETEDTTWSDEYRFRKVDGSYLNVYDRSYILRDHYGNAYRMIGSMADVTEMLITRKELQQSEENYRVLVEQATDGIMVTDIDGRFLIVNPSACKVLMYSEAELLTKTASDILDKDDIEKKPLRFEELRNGEKLTAERNVITGDKRVITLDINAQVLNDGRILVFIRDITEKKRAEEDIIKSNARFHIISKATSDIVWDWDIQEGRLWWNDNYYTILGFRKQREINDIESWFKNIHPDDRERVQKNIYAHFEGKELVWRDEYWYAKADGTYLYFLDRGHILRNNEGKAYRVIGSMIDFTDLFLAQEKVRKSEDNYRTLIEQATDAILIHTVDGVIHTYNKSAAFLTGYTIEEFGSLRLQDILVGDIITDPDNYAEILSGKPSIFYRHLKRKDGTIKEAEIIAKLIDGEKILVFARDVTDRKKAEEELANNELKFRTLTSNAPVGIIQTDVYGHTIYVNETWRSYTGMTFEEAMGDGWFNAVHPDDKTYLKNTWEEHVAKGLPSITEYRLIDKEGRTKWVSGNAVPLYNKDGEVTGYIGTIADMTERKMAEVNIRNSEETRRLIMSSSLDAIICMSTDGTITVWTPQAEKTFGWKENEIIGKRVADTIIPVQYRQRHEEGYRRYLQTGKEIMLNRLVETSGLHRDGYEFPIELSIIPIEQGDSSFFCAFIRNISERKQAELTIRRSEEQYRTLVEQAIDAIALYDADGKILDVNPGAEVLLGYSKTELCGMGLHQILAVEETNTNPVRYDILSGGSSTVKQRTMLRKDGSRVQTEVRSQQLPDGRFLSVVRDLTDRFEAQKKIQTEKELSDKVIDSLPGVFYWYDENLKFIRWNKQFEIVTGYTSEEIASMKPTDFFKGEGLTYIIDRLNHVFQHGHGDAEADFISKDGVSHPYFFNAIRVHFDGRPSLLGTGIDISDRIKAEKELKQSEEKYKLLFKNSPLPMWVYEITEMKILDVNDAALIHYGYSREEFLKLNTSNLSFLEKYVGINSSENFEKDILHTSGKLKHFRKNGEEIDVEITWHDIDYNDKPGRLVVAVDVTEKIRHEKEIKKTSEELRYLADHLHKVREEERTHMAREIHDELGQHLTVLKMDVAWLNKKIGDDADVAVKNKLADLLTMLDGTVRTVRRISSDLRPSLLDDLGLVAAMEWQLGEFEKHSGIKSSFHTTADDAVIRDDIKTGLFRIFQESLTNVARHAEAKNIAVDFQYTDKIFKLRIADDGKGFDERQVWGNKTLGILGMKERAAMIGGLYEISSSPGAGTTVLVTVLSDNINNNL